jgi:hypothetical protein
MHEACRNESEQLEYKVGTASPGKFQGERRGNLFTVAETTRKAIADSSEIDSVQAGVGNWAKGEFSRKAQMRGEIVQQVELMTGGQASLPRGRKDGGPPCFRPRARRNCQARILLMRSKGKCILRLPRGKCIPRLVWNILMSPIGMFEMHNAALPRTLNPRVCWHRVSVFADELARPSRHPGKPSSLAPDLGV